MLFRHPFLASSVTAQQRPQDDVLISESWIGTTSLDERMGVDDVVMSGAFGKFSLSEDGLITDHVLSYM